MSKTLKCEYVCFICHKIFKDPIYLSCSCKKSVCNEHIQAKNDKVECSTCQQTFYFSIFESKENSMLKQQIENCFHLNTQIKKLKNECEKCLSNMTSFIERFNLNINEFSFTQADHFENIRRDIDLKREIILNNLNHKDASSIQTFKQINEQSKAMVRQIEVTEQNFRQKFN